MKLCALFLPAALRAGADGLGRAGNPGTWSMAAQMTAARTEIGGVALDGKIYLAGGQEMGRPDSTLFQMFDPAMRTLPLDGHC
ncbi:MAG TPA: kelch repeat-containing protein [Micropepsaceae bacterium]|nr:kelch repeat-containing protein [Micropepsaceae bacterium]